MQMRCVNANRMEVETVEDRFKAGRGGGGVGWGLQPLTSACGRRPAFRILNALLIVLVVEASLSTGGKNTFLNAT